MDYTPNRHRLAKANRRFSWSGTSCPDAGSRRMDGSWRPTDGLGVRARTHPGPPSLLRNASLRNASDAAGVTAPAQPRAAREGTPMSGGPQRRSTRSPGELLLRPYGPPGRRSCGLPIQLPHSWRTWCSLADPAHSGQPCMRTKIPSRDRRNCTRRADEQAEIHRTGPRPRRLRASGGRGRDQTVTAARSQGR